MISIEEKKKIIVSVVIIVILIIMIILIVKYTQKRSYDNMDVLKSPPPENNTPSIKHTKHNVKKHKYSSIMKRNSYGANHPYSK